MRGGGFEAGRGMPAGRNVWEDRNAFGKFHQIHLVRLHGSLWLGVIGTDEFRVCRNLAVSCKIRGHKKNKFILGCAVAGGGTTDNDVGKDGDGDGATDDDCDGNGDGDSNGMTDDDKDDDDER